MPNSLGSRVAVAQQMCRLSIGKWVLLVLFSFFFPLPYCFHSSACSGCGGTWLPVRWAFLGLLVQFSLPAGRSQVSSRECGWGKAVRSLQQCVGQAPAPAAGTWQGKWNLALAGWRHPWGTLHGCVWKGEDQEREECLSEEEAACQGVHV